MKIETAPLTVDEADAAAALEARCFSAPWSREMIKAAVLQSDAAFLGAAVDGVFAGHVGMLCVLDEGQICNLAVAPAFRRMGVGSALLDALKTDAARRGLAVLMLEVRASNTAAQALYEKSGFERVGVRRGFYANPREDAFLYNLYLK